MRFGFSYIGLIWLIMLFVPNIIWTKHQPKDYDKYVKNESKVLLAFERTGQVMCTVTALIFSDFNIKSWFAWNIVLILSFVCMVIYEIFWIRYFRSEKTMKDYYSSLGLPLAGATYPVLAFFLLGIYGGNIFMLTGSIILGIGHIGIHHRHKIEACGKTKRHIAKRVFSVIGIVIVALVFGFFTFAIAARCYKQITRSITFRNGVNEGVYVNAGGLDQYMLLMGQDTANPVILSLHGGPGSSTSWVDYCYLDYLTDEYTVACWDERGCGRSYYNNLATDPDNETLSFEQQVEDMDELVDYLLDRFDQDKIIIMGHSYGSVLGSQYVSAHPEKVAAYIGIGQVVNTENWYSESFAYEDALRIATERGDDTTAMEEAYERFAEDPTTVRIMELRNYTYPYHTPSVTQDVSTLAAITSPYVGVSDARWYCLQLSLLMFGNDKFNTLMAPLNDYVNSFNAFKLNTDYQVPVFFISGSDDWACPVPITEEYMDVISAPYKDMRLIEGCGHSPMSQLPEEFADTVKELLGTIE
ncbi:MAG: alpha/beta hydrolase [Saccharofermentans sp.]|nr:alpha/beta hydrolase [Saccharofermentans sp.]